VGKRGIGTDASSSLGAGAAAAAWSCDRVMERAGTNGQKLWFCFWALPPLHCKALEL